MQASPKHYLHGFIVALFFSGETMAVVNPFKTFRPRIYDTQETDTSTALFLIGNWRIHAALGLETAYDSNTFYENQGSKKDIAVRVIPGIDIARKSSRWDALLSYRYKHQNYSNHSSQDYQGHYAAARFHGNIFSKISFYLEDQFNRDIDTGDEVIFIPTGRWHNQVEVGLTYRSTNETLQNTLAYSHATQNFDSPLSVLNSEQQKLAFINRIHMPVSPGSYIYDSLEISRTAFPRDANLPSSPEDSQGWRASLGLFATLGRTLSTRAGVGHSRLHFEKGGETSQWNLESEVKFAPSPKFKLNASYRRSLDTGSFANYYQQDQWQAEVNYRAWRPCEFYSKHTLGFFDFAGNQGASNTELRSDTFYHMNSGVIWYWSPWLSSGLEYQFTHRDSNLNTNVPPNQLPSFTKHVVVLTWNIYY